MAEYQTENDIKSALEFNKTGTDRFANFMSDSLGSIAFLTGCCAFFIAWIGWNLAYTKSFDPAPFPLLEMIVSLFAIFLSVTVLINQNRQGKMDKTRQQVEFEVNVRAEEEITKILNMLHEIQLKMGIDKGKDPELEKMKESTDVKEIHKNIENDHPA